GEAEASYLKKGAHYKGRRRRWLDLLVVNCAGGWRGALVGLAARPWAVWSTDDPPPVEVPASGGGVEAEVVGAGGQFDRVAEGSPALPAAGAVDVDVAQGGFSVVELQRQAAAVVRARSEERRVGKERSAGILLNCKKEMLE